MEGHYMQDFSYQGYYSNCLAGNLENEIADSPFADFKNDNRWNKSIFSRDFESVDSVPVYTCKEISKKMVLRSQ
jgi:hypothetical protein